MLPSSVLDVVPTSKQFAVKYYKDVTSELLQVLRD